MAEMKIIVNYDDWLNAHSCLNTLYSKTYHTVFISNLLIKIVMSHLVLVYIHSMAKLKSYLTILFLKEFLKYYLALEKLGLQTKRWFQTTLTQEPP